MNLNEINETVDAIKRSQWTSLADDFVTAAVRYARLRTDWALASDAARIEMDTERSRAHTAFIDCCNILSRNMAKSGEDVCWRTRIGNDRRVIGDFACHLHCLLGLQAR